ncbi:phage holin family protein [Paenibacillus sp. 481]|uniref:phage holin family protein n=1 Tax=Paenibacillus sp. 481 TaxID=2835869 RepID=UPI0022B32755|nr:phage holin family protein [Paenibacillus sp. 481]UHA76161.1 phage holin family protein [Paenibacillus sp. 481]
MKQTALNSIGGVCGVVLTFMFGEWTHLLTLFMLTIAVDYISGIAASLREGKGLSSLVGFWGLARKAFMLLIITLAHHMDNALGTSWIKDGSIYFYLANELISITENYGRLGLPLPTKIRNIIASLKSEPDKELPRQPRKKQ